MNPRQGMVGKGRTGRERFCNSCRYSHLARDLIGEETWRTLVKRTARRSRRQCDRLAVSESLAE